jgi:hypothetical protein
MTRKQGLVILASLLTLFVAIKETREPYLWLFLDDILRPKPDPETIALSEDLAVRLYADTRPHTGKIARLQKGLLLVAEGQERIEEGFGFGLPLVEVGGQAYLSRTATIEQDGSSLVKHYIMDTVDTPSGFLRRKYEPVAPLGTIAVRYTPKPDGVIVVSADFSDLDEPWDKVYLMNEQGARVFTRYEEPGLVLEGGDLGKWQSSSAQRSCLSSKDQSLQFCVETEGEGSRYYGRERYNQYYWIGVYALSWAGIDLEVEAPADGVAYRIEIEVDNLE